jgi:hypothetical protein
MDRYVLVQLVTILILVAGMTLNFVMVRREAKIIRLEAKRAADMIQDKAWLVSKKLEDTAMEVSRRLEKVAEKEARAVVDEAIEVESQLNGNSE